jgi:Ser/Thr protein kinase RdoA (MazF antagonist)
MVAEISIAPVLDQYSGLGPIRHIQSLANAGGFSGSFLWHIEREAGDLCLRRWPKEHPSADKLRFIHNVLRTLGESELSCIPVPMWNKKWNKYGKSFVTYDEHLWELTPWLPGKADFQENPSRHRLASVIKVVARIHQLSQSQYPVLFQQSLTLHSRRDQLQRFMAAEADQIAAAVERHATQALQVRGRGLLSHFRRRAPQALLKLTKASALSVPRFPVIRDLWHDHVLLTGDEVTGIVDFGAMRLDSAACDLSRLLGSLVGNDREAWEFARHAYNSIRPLSADEWQLAQALDEANVILAGLNWLDWICVQGRTFEDYDAVYARLDELLVRLEGKSYSPPA